VEAFNILGEKLLQPHSKKRYFADHRPIMFKKCVTVKRNHEFVERMCHIFIAKLFPKEEPKSFIIKAPANAERSGMDERCNGDTRG
jgi:hypothetical protein